MVIIRFGYIVRLGDWAYPMERWEAICRRRFFLQGSSHSIVAFFWLICPLYIAGTSNGCFHVEDTRPPFRPDFLSLCLG